MKSEEEFNASPDLASREDEQGQTKTKGAQAAAAEAFASAEGLGGDAEAARAVADEQPPSSAPLTPEAMQAEIEALREAVAAFKDETVRAQAELDNVRKRAAREVENAHKFGLDRIMSELLPVRDSLELGSGAAAADGVDVASVREGLDLTLKMLDTATQKFGLVEVDPLGEQFDPEKHQAISVQEIEGSTSGTVLNVVQKGFTLNERLIRAAMVIVTK